jgi:hypothetical protein
MLFFVSVVGINGIMSCQLFGRPSTVTNMMMIMNRDMVANVEISYHNVIAHCKVCTHIKYLKEVS